MTWPKCHPPAGHFSLTIDPIYMWYPSHSGHDCRFFCYYNYLLCFFNFHFIFLNRKKKTPPNPQSFGVLDHDFYPCIDLCNQCYNDDTEYFRNCSFQKNFPCTIHTILSPYLTLITTYFFFTSIVIYLKEHHIMVYVTCWYWLLSLNEHSWDSYKLLCVHSLSLLLLLGSIPVYGFS